MVVQFSRNGNVITQAAWQELRASHSVFQRTRMGTVSGIVIVLHHAAIDLHKVVRGLASCVPIIITPDLEQKHSYY